MKGQVLLKKLPEIIVTLKETWTATNKYFKIFWLTVFLGCLGMMMMEIWLLYSDFFDYPTDTNIQMTMKQSIKYPVLILCAVYPMNYTNMRALKIGDHLANYIYSSMFAYGHPTTYSDGQLKEFDAAYAQLMKGDYSIKKTYGFFMRYGLHCRNVFKLCSSQSLEFDCCSSEALEYMLPNTLGQCFMIRTPANFSHQSLPGERGSLRFILNREVYFGDNYTNPLHELRWQMYYVSPDYRITGESDIDFNPTTVRPGHVTDIQLKPVSYRLLGKPYRPYCSAAVYHRPDNTSVPYQVELCFRECEAAITMKKCECVRLGTLLYSDPHRPICTPQQSRTCAHREARHMECDCPVSCKYIAYNPLKEMTPLPREWKHQLTKQGYQIGPIGKTDQISVINVHYAVLLQQSMIQVPKWTVTRMLGSIGGQCSLWLGIRIFTIIQLVFYVTLSCCTGFAGSHNDKQEHPNFAARKGIVAARQHNPRIIEIEKSNFYLQKQTRDTSRPTIVY